MRLSKLTLSGFKSFAKTTNFEFPSEVSAIVGPNGSGKSNVAEAVRWVLGEQSMKILRGKRGEDLIFSGSPQIARMGKAAVKLVFDNKDRAIPLGRPADTGLALDFQEVMLERKIFRDGTNEYYLNGSQVRLKDIVELLARMGLGETKHNIIGQGEVDRILLASPLERREILEEAIGLRLYQLKKREAERKLEETGKNIAQVEALIKEISPHLKFLKSQADKAEKHGAVRKELHDYYRAYVIKESSAIAEEEKNLAAKSDPQTAKLKNLEKEIAQLGRALHTSEETASGERLKAKELELETLEAKRRELERGLGRIEGRMESRVVQPKYETRRINIGVIETALNPIIKELRETSDDDLNEMRRRIDAVAAKMERLIIEWKDQREQSTGHADISLRLQDERNRLHQELKTSEGEIAQLRKELQENIRNIRQAQAGLKDRFERLRKLEEEANSIRADLQRMSFESEKLHLRSDELKRVIEESGTSNDELKEVETPFTVLDTAELRKKVEKLKLKLEEIGGIDLAVLKEYNDTRSRHEFLERELNDLSAAQKNLLQLTAELEDRIERDFKTGFVKIKEEFHNYFRIIFGGGRGLLEYVAIRRPPEDDSEKNEIDDGEENQNNYGINIDVDLPRKKIKGLAMLSGGERALVSIALLFAITAVNPPPFLVLDETDAALDEANSQKYAAILKELSQKTQLILITHNRETMKQAGVLYGVTMGDDGISKILSLKLEEAESYGNR